MNFQFKERKIYRKNCFDEITHPKAIFEFPEGDLLCIVHSYFAQWPARGLQLRGNFLSIYHASSLELIAHLESFRYPINDLAYHKEKQLLLIATGKYDGGYHFHGALLYYDFAARRLARLLQDDRQFDHCSFHQGYIECHVLPIDDSDNRYQYKVYQLPLVLGKLQKLMDFEPIKIIGRATKPFDFAARDKRLQTLNAKLEEIARERKQDYDHRCMAYDLKFIDQNRLIIGFANGKIGVLDLENNSFKSRKLEEKGACTQVFLDRDKASVYANVYQLAYAWREGNTVYQTDPSLSNQQQLAKGGFCLSQSQDGHFLARQIGCDSDSFKDILFDASFKKVAEKRLGHYDLFNHYLRIDGDDYLYAALGTPEDQHANKRLVKIAPNTMEIVSEMNIETRAEHLNDLNAIKIGDQYVIEGEVYHPSPSVRNRILFAIDEKGKKQWLLSVPNQSTGITSLDTFPNHIALVFANGAIWIMDCSVGLPALKLPRNESVKGYPLSITNIDNKLAIGYDNGLIELILLEEL